MTRSLLVGCLALALLVPEAAPAFADLPGPYPWSKRPNRDRYITGPVKVITPDGEPTPPADEKAAPAPDAAPLKAEPKRSGPFRSCGSGAGLGLAGVGLAWGMFWVGNRVARSVRRK